MKVRLCYKKEETPKGTIICRKCTTVKEAKILWDTVISKIAICGYIERWNEWYYYVHKILKEEVKK